MKKTTKVLAMVLALVLALTLICSCDIITTNTAKYRTQTAITVGNEKITVGDFLDTYTSYYYQYYSYISQGYYTAEQVFQLAARSLIQVNIRVDAYKKYADEKSLTYTHSLNATYADSKYLTEEETKFAIKYALNSIYGTLDNYVEQEIAKFYDLADAATDDTSRDFTEYDVIDTTKASAYADYKYNDTMSTKDFDARALTETAPADWDNLLYSSDATVSNNETLKDAIDGFNTRIVDAIKAADGYVEGDEDSAHVITEDEYRVFQQRALKSYRQSTENNYDYDFATALSTQVKSTIKSMIAVKYNYVYYTGVEADISSVLATLSANWINDKAAYEAAYAITSDAFVDYIEGLADTSYIYTVPAEYANSYVYTKNLLIPFSTKQTAALTAVKNRLGGTTSDEYKEFRASLASNIIAQNFTDETLKDKDLADYTYEENTANTFFNYTTGSQTVTLKSGTALATALNSGSLDAAAFIELMKTYNTDTTQHSKVYDYIVRIDGTPQSYTAKWVTEYVDGAKAAALSADKYALAVSDYGVHIIFYDGPVVAQAGNFTAANIYDLTTPESRYFQTYYTAKSSELLTAAFDVLVQQYLDDSLISETKVFEKIVSQASVTFDMDTIVEGLKSN